MENGKVLGGKQRGSESSVKHEKVIREVSFQVWEELKKLYPEWVKSGKLEKRDKIKYKSSVAQPDGGVYLFNDKPILAIECKYQNVRGNACERGYKNYDVLMKRNNRQDLDYLLFCNGPGANLTGKTIFDENSYKSECPISYVFEKGFSSIVDGEFNVLRKGKPSCFCSIQSFSVKVIYNILLSRLIEIIDEKIKIQE